MKILSKSFHGKRKEVVTVHVDRPAYVKFFTPDQYHKYKGGRSHRYWGGHYEEMPAEFEVPCKGEYFAVVEKGTYNNPIELEARVEIGPPRFDYMNGSPENETHSDVVGEYDDTLE